MKRTQIQLPDPLWQEVKRVAELEDWSIAEVVRRGAESFVSRYRGKREKGGWRPPSPIDLGPFKSGAREWKELLLADEENV